MTRAVAPAVASAGVGPSITFQEYMTGDLLCGDPLAYGGPRITVADLVGHRHHHPLSDGLDYNLAPLQAAAAQAARDKPGASSYHLTIRYDDWRPERPDKTSKTALIDLRPAAVTSGTVSIPGVSTSPLAVRQGFFYLRVGNEARVENDHMLYVLRLVEPGTGTGYDFFGFKVLRPGVAPEGWAATTTLYVAVFEKGSSRCRAAGIMHISFAAVAALVRSLHVEDGSKIGYAARFGWRFAEPVVRRYGGPLAERSRLVRPTRPDARSRPAGSREVWQRDGHETWQKDPDSTDGAQLRLTRYPPATGAGARNHPLLVTHGYGMSARSFAWPTDPNGLEPAPRSFTGYFRAHGYEVWLLDNRGSIDLPSCDQPFNLDDIALFDWPMAVAQVGAVTGAQVHAFGHCVGSATLLMAMLAGLPGLKSASCSQFLTHIRTSGWNVAKADVWLGKVLEKAGITRLQPDSRPTLGDVILDLAAAPLPLPKGERCGLALCRWINATYGLTHTHSQLDEAAHQALPDLFGDAAVPGLDHLQHIVRARRLVDHRGNDAYMSPARTGGITVPVHLLYGERNFIFHAEGNRLSSAWLESTFPKVNIVSTALPDYAHLDAMIGPRAAVDVFPAIARFLDSVD